MLKYLFISILCIAPFAHADIYKYVDEHGNVTFSNIPMRNAQRILAEPGALIPAPRPRGNSTPKERSPQTATPGNFPRVDAATQKSRDSNRHLILNEELTSEQKNLAEARRLLADAENSKTAEEKASPQKYVEKIGRIRNNMTLHEKNISALQSEISRLR
ncbi:DUF4124 domain-containing protein [Iodobacter ciconiae]|uniref:DUF4124 domain-containing protein n=1 Tax=Iodobacter ciconiae TaxID=2496266 RepID=A0A3S8ZTW4_9NEIS|nr:DUF4124 domain-containing protein [Iodobacter ciconiae]AZN36871.1 DUF4124 domain-containing protein [Iodobacter ciconiae]